MDKIPNPSKEECSKYLKQELDEHYIVEGKTVEKVFKLYPKNTVIEEVLIKVSLLNDFYSTNIFSTYPVAKHIVDLNIDERLKKGNKLLVDDIAHNKLNGKEKYFYSFATKYCAIHQPALFPIYDNFVGKMLRYFRNQTGFAKFKNADLRDYKKYYEIYIEFINSFALNDFTLREIDLYLWKLGKEQAQK
ncbi:hypothetical protein [Treponema pedis]|uniref:hypothetical protein n=1 Tax=Treponema pedis TaxID=409322 RepID=UPI003D203F98